MERFELARELVKEAGAALRQSHLGAGAVFQKTGHRDLVTCCDRETERYLRENIQRAFPQDAIIGEEYPASPSTPEGATWYLDPIDGTTNFVNQHKNYAISVGCWKGRTPLFGLVLDVERDVLYQARPGAGAWRGEQRIHVSQRTRISELLLTTPGVFHTFLKPYPRQEAMLRLAEDVRGVRSLGSVALELCAVAAGEADLFVALRSAPWDHNAARIIVTEAGGQISALSGGQLPVDEKCAVLSANSDAMLQTILRDYLGDE